MLKKGLVDILIELKILDNKNLQKYKAEAKKENKSLEEYLTEQKIISPEDLAKAYSKQAGVEYIAKINDRMAEPTLLAKIPLKFLRENIVIPVKIENKIIILISDPSNFQAVDEVGMIIGSNEYGISTSKVIIDAINRFYPLEGTQEVMEELEEEEEKEIGEVDFEAVEEKDIVSMAAEAPIIKLVNHVLYQAVKRNTSDIHIEPFEKEVRIRYRVDGVMFTVMTPPKRIQAALVSRIKIMANLNIAEKRKPQDGRIDIKVAGKEIDIRVSILPIVYGERVVMRLLDKSKTIGKLNQLGFSTRDFNVIQQSISQPNGIILVSGPTGSGKTTTLYSILNQLNTPEVNIITVEDPVEYQMNGIAQVQVKAKIGLTFAAALRSILRQDPDIIMIGETRDQETAQIAIQSALTGHLVLSTIHTNNAPATITRLLDMGIEPFLIASTIESITAQRLVRKLCDKCKKAYKPPQELLTSLGITKSEGEKITFYKPVGCDECDQIGYKGRLAIFEIMPMSNELAKLTMDRADTSLIRKQAIKEGMTLLIQDGVEKIKKGLTSIEEVLSVATLYEEEEEF